MVPILMFVASLLTDESPPPDDVLGGWKVQVFLLSTLQSIFGSVLALHAQVVGSVAGSVHFISVRNDSIASAPVWALHVVSHLHPVAALHFVSSVLVSHFFSVYSSLEPHIE